MKLSAGRFLTVIKIIRMDVRSRKDRPAGEIALGRQGSTKLKTKLNSMVFLVRKQSIPIV
jgi:hypothetical protein